jgi:pantothenate kinase, type III
LANSESLPKCVAQREGGAIVILKFFWKFLYIVVNEKTMMNLIIDEGNSSIKIALFEENRCKIFKKIENETVLAQFLQEFSLGELKAAVVASVVKDAEQRFSFLNNILPEVLYLNALSPMPFVNKYATPQTLGIDRLALAAAGVHHFPNCNVLIIDAGTCITFDVVTKNKEYLGGAIAPGIGMRLRAMHEFTSKLPLIEEQDYDNEEFIGNTTQSCMLSGVYCNVVQEIEGVIGLYKQRFQDLEVILTGGNHFYLQKRIKSRIFASSLVLVEGLNAILEYQKQL